MSPLSSGYKNIPIKKLAELLLPTAFLLGLFFDSEDGGNMFFRNVGLSMDYMAIIYQKTELFITTGVQTSNPTSQICFLYVLQIFPTPGRPSLDSDETAIKNVTNISTGQRFRLYLGH
jgi:hypothetical protein